MKRSIKTIERDEASIGANHFADGIYAEGHTQARTGNTVESLKGTVIRKHSKGHEAALRGSNHMCLRGLEFPHTALL